MSTEGLLARSTVRPGYCRMATWEQIAEIQRLGGNPPPDLNYAQASKAIQALKQRRGER